jgi:hypothetical protein
VSEDIARKIAIQIEGKTEHNDTQESFDAYVNTVSEIIRQNLPQAAAAAASAGELRSLKPAAKFALKQLELHLHGKTIYPLDVENAVRRLREALGVPLESSKVRKKRKGFSASIPSEAAEQARDEGGEKKGEGK